MRLRIANPHAVVDNRTLLTVDDFIRIRDLFFERRGKCHHFESRAGFVDIADGAVGESSRCDLLADIRIEGGAICERKNLTSVRVLNDDGAGNSLCVVDGLFEFFFSDVLDVLIDRQDNVLTGHGLCLDIREPLLAGVDRNEHFAGTSAVFLMIRRPPRSTLFPYRRASDLPGAYCTQLLTDMG